MRLYRLDDFSMTCKFKGLLNEVMQIRGGFSDDGRFVLAGSETGACLVWASPGGAGARGSSDQLRGASFFSKAKDRNASYETWDVAKCGAGSVRRA